MKTKRIVTILACVLLAAFLLGFTETIRVADSENNEAPSGNGRLIGAFITTEYLDLFDAEAFFGDNVNQIMSGGEISGEENTAYQGRLYATLVDNSLTDEDTGEVVQVKAYVFEGVDGICCFAAEMQDEAGTYTATSGDEAIIDGRTTVSCTDEGDSVTLEGTICVSVQSGARSFYVNPVYQTEDGRVYTTNGNGVSMGGDLTAGMSHTTTLTESRSTMVGGENTGKEFSVTITIEYIAPPERISVIQLDANSEIRSRAEYTPGAVPDTITADTATEYIIVETFDADAEIRRELYQKSDEWLTTVFCREDGICIANGTAIVW